MQNLPKRWEIFTSKKGCECVYRFTTIFRWSCRKMMVEMVVLVVWKCRWRGWEYRGPYERMKKKKEKKWSEWAGQREKMDSVKMSGGEWWVVGLGGGHVGTIKRNLTFTFFFLVKKKKIWLGRYTSSFWSIVIPMTKRDPFFEIWGWNLALGRMSPSCSIWACFSQAPLDIMENFWLQPPIREWHVFYHVHCTWFT